ncbi:GTP-binding protein [Persephonella sp.]|uniref:GTP-binding protein n=1 Tax=Persephonella sp. TaxID=2060922 RepID=UPI002601D2C1|nr:GTP-binding protein [Persephonella sp.]
MNLKLLITGAFAAGKTQFINTLTGDAVKTEVQLSQKTEKLQKDKTTVAMDYGKIEINGTNIHLFGTPGQDRFDFMLDILSQYKDGAVIIVDSANPESIYKSKKFIDFIKNTGKPFVIACNKQDLDGSLSPEEIAKILGIPSNMVKPLIAKDKDSCLNILGFFHEFILNKKVA